MRYASTLAALLTTLALAAPAHAALITYNVSLDAAQAGVASPATGSAVLVLDDTANSLSVDLSYSGLTTPATNAHIHCCAPPGTSAGVIIPFVPPFVTGLTSGTFVNTFALTSTQVTQVESGQSYINIHTSMFPAGEIRGQIVAAPEPAAVISLALGLAALGLRRAWRLGGH
jgi:hypothetical protein